MPVKTNSPIVPSLAASYKLGLLFRDVELQNLKNYYLIKTSTTSESGAQVGAPSGSAETEAVTIN